MGVKKMIDISLLIGDKTFNIYLMAMLLMWLIVFVSFATGAYKKSYSNIIFLISTAIAVTALKHGYECMALTSLIIGSIFSTIRTMSHHINDMWVRGKNV